MTPQQVTTPQAVLAATCCALQLQLGDIYSSSRHPQIVLARALIAHLSRQLTLASFPEIAAALRRRNHSGVVSGQRWLLQQGATIPGPARQGQPLAQLVAAQLQSSAAPPPPLTPAGRPLPSGFTFLAQMADPAMQQALQHSGGGEDLAAPDILLACVEAAPRLSSLIVQKQPPLLLLEYLHDLRGFPHAAFAAVAGYGAVQQLQRKLHIVPSYALHLHALLKRANLIDGEDRATLPADELRRRLALPRENYAFCHLAYGHRLYARPKLAPLLQLAAHHCQADYAAALAAALTAIKTQKL